MSAAYGTGHAFAAVAIAGQAIAPSSSLPCRKPRPSASRARARIAERRHPVPAANQMATPCGTAAAMPGVLLRSPDRAVPYLLAAFNRKVRREYQF